MDAPLPPRDLANRVGHSGSDAEYLAIGATCRSVVDDALPDDWDWRGKRVLDFGAGSGRTLRHFLPEAADAQFEGCDIDREQIDWLNTNLGPHLTGFANDPGPPLDRPDDSYDVVYAFSVFTHITDQWAAWLVELHRVLRPGGYLIATFLGEGMSQAVAGEPWDPDRIGMTVLAAHQGWDAGGPSVLLSPWWINEHWGRAFEIADVRDSPTAGTHGLIVARPRPVAVTEAGLQEIDANDARELAALRHNLALAQRESAALAQTLADTVEGYEHSRSWRLTAPLRRATRTEE